MMTATSPPARTRVCQACHARFELEPRAGRPHVLCGLCRTSNPNEVVRIRRDALSPRPVGIGLRRPGKKTKYVYVWLTPEEVQRVVSDLLTAKVGVAPTVAPEPPPRSMTRASRVRLSSGQ